MRLLVSDESGVGDGAEALGDAAALQHVFDLAVRIGDDRDRVALPISCSCSAVPGRIHVPVAGVADAGDELVADCVVIKSDLGEQLGVEHPPETVVGVAVPGHHSIELILGSAFQIAQKIGIGQEAAFC